MSSTNHMIQQRHSDFTVAITLLFFCTVFFLLDAQSFPTGDDLGYMFADSAHHVCDGSRVESLSDVLKTQCSHYMTCNGRFLLHSLAMSMLSLWPGWLVTLSNTIMFGIALWLFTALSSGRMRVSASDVTVGGLWMCLCVPMIGITWMSLVSYSVNYLWSAAVNLLFVLLVMRNFKSVWLLPLALLAGALQESFSLPVSCGLLVLLISDRSYRTPRFICVACLYWLATSILFFAPGNLTHAAQGGGFEASALMHRFTAMCASCTRIPAVTAALILLVMAATPMFKSVRKMMWHDRFLWSIFCGALLLDAITFTSHRQLTLLGLTGGILCMRSLWSFYPALSQRIFSLKGAIISMFILLLGFACVYPERAKDKRRYEALMTQAAMGSRLAVYDLTDGFHPDYIPRALMRSFDLKSLPVIFDGYTKRGLSRLYDAEKSDNLTTILPAPIEYIVASGATSILTPDSVYTEPLLPGFNCFMIPNGEKASALRTPAGIPVPYEMLHTEVATFVVVPSASPVLSHR